MEWEQPHWSGRPQPSAGPRPRLRPNGFARIARFAVLNRHLVLGLWLFICLVSAVYAVIALQVDPEAAPRITLDDKTAEAQAALERDFPAIDQTFIAIVEARDGSSARTQAGALATALKARTDLFASSFVPGTDPFYETNSLLFHPVEDVRARVDQLLQMQPLYQAMAAAPDIMGLATLVSEIGKAVQQGRSPAGLEDLLGAAAQTIEAEVRGSPRPINWPALAGIGGEANAQRWFVIATPLPGVEREAASFARLSSEGMQGVRWLWPRQALGRPASPLRDFVVPGGLSLFITLTLLGAGLGSFRLTVALLLPAAAVIAVSGASAAALGRVLDGATWSFAASVLAPVIVGGSVLALAYGQARARGVAIVQAAMLAAQKRGGLASGFCFLFAAFWVSWLVRQLPSLGQHAMIALIGTAAAWAAVMTLLPAAAAFLDAGKDQAEGHWLDDALDSPDSRGLRNIMDILAMVLLAASVFCAAFLPAVRFGDRQAPQSQSLLLETPDARGAIHVLTTEGEAAGLVAQLSVLPEVGAIRTVTQFLPPEPAVKVAELRRLDAVMPLNPQPRPPPEDDALEMSFAGLEAELTAIAAGPSTSQSLRDAALRLRRAVNLYVNPQPPSQARVIALEDALFAGLGELSRTAERLSRLKEPQLADLDPELRRRFVSPGGVWRIEVMPRSGTGVLSFAAAIRKVVPAAAGEPVAALVRNEIIHHETLLALGTAFAAIAVIVLAVLRNPLAWLLSLIPVSAFVTLTAAATVLSGAGFSAAMLAGASVAAAILLSSAMIMTERITAGGGAIPGEAIRSALIPPLVMAGAVAPLAISSRPAVSDLGSVVALMMLSAALICLLLVPALARWFAGWGHSSPR